MWRTRSPSETWERRKTYLIRNLFEDTPLLSPIYEAPEPCSSFLTKDTLYRPYSPLPDLIIEIEPKKPNLCDEPEEFYTMLRKKIRRLYRRDFLGINETSSSSIKSGYIINIDEGDIEETFTQETKSTTVDEQSIESEERIDSQLVTTQADIHKKTSDEESILKELERGTSSSSGSRKNHDLSRSTSQKIRTHEEFSLHDKIEILTTSSDVSFENRKSLRSASSSVSSVEIIRRKLPSMDLGSVGHGEVYKSKSNDSVMDFEENIAMDYSESPDEIITPYREMGIANEIPIIEEGFLTITSTPKSTKKSSIRKKSIEKRLKRRLVSYSSSLSSTKSIANYGQKALQTSFSDNESNSDELWSNFFVGIPSMYNLCSCANHVCK